MRKLFTLIAVIHLFTYAQETSQMWVTGKGKQTEGEFIGSNVRDANGDICAGLIILSDLTDLHYTSYNGIVKLDRKPGRDLLYLSPSERVVEIYKTGYVPLKIILSEYGIYLQSKMVHQVEVTGTKAGVTRADDKLIEIVFQSNEGNIYSSFGDYTPMLSVSNFISYKLPEGNYTFKFQKTGFTDVVKTIELKEPQTVKIFMEPGETTTKRFALPGIIVITSEPSNCEIIINGQKIGNTPFQGELSAGNHQMEIRKPLYETDVSTFVLEEGKTVTLPMKTLKPKFGYLSVSSNIPQSRITLNDKPFGDTPLNKTEIEAGSYKIKVESDMYYPFTEEFTLEVGGEKNITVELKPAFGSLEINTSPENGAEIFLDGRKIGQTPFQQDKVASGRYLLKVTKELFGDVEEQITIQDGQKLARNIVLKQNFGQIDVDAPFSQIFVNDKLVGKGRYRGRLTPGQYKVRAERESHYSKEENVMLVLGDMKKVKLETEPMLGTLTIIVEPSEANDAEIFVDNELRGNAPLVFTILVGDYTVSAKKANYVDAFEKISIVDESKRSINFKMITYEGSRLQTINKWGTIKWISLGSAALLGGVAAYFKLSANKNFDNYNSAVTTADAMEYKKTTNNHNNLSQMFIFGATAAISSAVISWIVQMAL